MADAVAIVSVLVLDGDGCAFLDGCCGRCFLADVLGMGWVLDGEGDGSVTSVVKMGGMLSSLLSLPRAAMTAPTLTAIGATATTGGMRLVDVDGDVVVVGLITEVLVGLEVLVVVMVVEATFAATPTAVATPTPSPLTPTLRAVADEPSNGPEVGRTLAPAATLRPATDNEAWTQRASWQPNEKDVVAEAVVVVVDATILIAVEVGLRPRPGPLTPTLTAVTGVGRTSAPTTRLRLDAANEALTQTASLQPNGRDVVAVFEVPVVAAFAAVLTAVVVGLPPKITPLTPMLKAVAEESSSEPEVGRASAPTARLRLDAAKEALTQAASWHPNEEDIAAAVAAVLTVVVVGLLPKTTPLTPMLKAVVDESSNVPEVGRASAPTTRLRLDAASEALTQMAS